MKPYYFSDQDFNTNAPSYYEALARFNEALKNLTERMNDVEAHFKELVIGWLKDGTLADLLEQVLLDDYMTAEEVQKMVLDLARALKEDMEELDRLIETYSKREKIIYTIGAKGDYPNLNTAIADIRNMLVYPDEIELMIQSDYVMNEQIIIEDKDLSFITITSDRTVSCTINSNIQTVATKNGALYTPFFYIKNGKSPRIKALFNFTSPYNEVRARICGMVTDNSDVLIEETKGFTNFSWGGLILLDGSNGMAIGANFSGNGNFDQVTPREDNVRTAYEGKGVLVQNSSFTGDGLIANKCGDVGVHVQLASRARFSGATITGCGHHAVVASQGSAVTARNGKYTHTQDDNVVCETGASLDISGSDCSYSHFTNGVVAHKNGNVTFTEGTAHNNASWGIHAVNDGHVNAEGTSVKFNGNSGISTGRLGVIYFRFGTASNNGGHGINVSDVSQVLAQDIVAENNANNGISNSGGEIDVSNAKIRNNGNNGVGTYTGGRTKMSGAGTLIEGNKQFGIMAENGEINARNVTIRNNTDVDVRASMGGRITGTNITTTVTTTPMYVVSTGGVIHVVESAGYGNMPINVMQQRGLIMSNTIQGATS